MGAINDESERIEEQTSLLEWALRLTSLTGPVKKHTQDYTLRYLLRQGEKAGDFYKFEIDKSRFFELDLYYRTERLEDLEVMAQDMIYANRFDVGNALEAIIKERFVCPKPS